jgi:mono/diheme cytochrome c family protein
MRARALLLVMTIGIAVVVVACGRASESDINAALGITPSPTRSAEDIATATAQAVAAASAAASGSPGAVAQGDITLGQQQFGRWCQQCHRPDGTGRAPALAGADSPVSDLSDDQLYDLIRNGTNHDPPGAYETFELTDRQIAGIIAYLRSITK